MDTSGRKGIGSIERSYLAKADREIHENANTMTSYSDFLGFLMGKLLKAPRATKMGELSRHGWSLLAEEGPPNPLY